MNDQVLEAGAKIQIRKPVAEVFEAIVEPEKMSNYFIAKGSGRMEAGKKVMWSFPEAPFSEAFPIRVDRIEKDRHVSFYWEGIPGAQHLVQITLEAAGPEATVVSVSEKGGRQDEAGLKWLKGNTEGWANFLACMKAYLEYGINLRKGAFDFMAG